MEKQKTIAKDISFSGKALQTGKQCKVNCKPLPQGEGIVFKRIDLKNAQPIHLGKPACENSYKRRTAIGGTSGVQTVEHLLAALWAVGVDNILVEVDGAELPALDGSAIEFFNIIKDAGITEQRLEREYIKILEEISVEEKKRKIKIVPADNFSVSYLIDYKIPSIGCKNFDITLNGEIFEKEIAPARTFCLKREAILLRLLGFGRGATYENTLIMGKKGPIRTSLRFEDEPLRHKILDLVGDLYMLGRPIMGKIVAEKSGHALNAKLVEKIYQKYVSKKKRQRRKNG